MFSQLLRRADQLRRRLLQPHRLVGRRPEQRPNFCFESLEPRQMMAADVGVELVKHVNADNPLASAEAPVAAAISSAVYSSNGAGFLAWQRAGGDTAELDIWKEQFGHKPQVPLAQGPTILVTNTNDAGTGSLRWAIESANATPGENSIVFNLRNDGVNTYQDVDSHLSGGDAWADVFVIRLNSELPALTDTSGGTFIDGRSQSRFYGNRNPFGPEVVLDGSNISVTASGIRMVGSGADENRLEGLNIQGFLGEGVMVVRSDHNVISGNYIGTDATGTESRATGASGYGGVLISAGSYQNLIGSDLDGERDTYEANLISGNNRHGVRIQNGAATDLTHQNTIQGNFIGTDIHGRVAPALGQQKVGVLFVGASNGTGVFDNVVTKNVVAGNGRSIQQVNLNETANSTEGNFGARLAASIVDDVLHVTGSETDDQIQIYEADGTIYVQDFILGTILASVDARNVIEIYVDVRGGDDWVNIDEASIGVSAIIYGGSGDDTLMGGSESDKLYGGYGNDELLGRGGKDIIDGQWGNDLLIGGDGNDRLSGNTGRDHLLGGAGNDELFGWSGKDQLYGEGGDDVIHAGSGSDLVDGGTGNDEIYGDSGNDVIYAGTGHDWVSGGDGNDKIHGERGNDVLYGNLGGDRIDGGRDNDRIYGNGGDDWLLGGSGKDKLYGSAGEDYLDGGSGQDLLSGGYNNDALIGGSGYDTLVGGHGRDELKDTYGIKYQEDDPTGLGTEYGTLTQSLSWGDVIEWGKDAVDWIAGAAEWTWDRITSVTDRVGRWAEELDNRLVRIAENVLDVHVGAVKILAPVFSNSWPHQQKFWRDWGDAWKEVADSTGRIAVDVAEVGGLTLLWETAFDFVKPYIRGLNADELDLARSVFGDSIDYSRVRIDEFSVLASIGRTHVIGHTINSPGGFIDDTLIHELVHIWQYEQDGLVYAVEALADQYFGDGYAYVYQDLVDANKPGERMSAFNREQQGEIIKDYFKRRKNILHDLEAEEFTAQQLTDLAQRLIEQEVYIQYVAEVSTLTPEQLRLPEGPHCPSIPSSDGANPPIVINIPGNFAPSAQGDFNHDMQVDASDYAYWQASFGATITPFLGADGDGDGRVGRSDYHVWKANCGRNLSGPFFPTQQIPPPQTVSPLTLQVNAPTQQNNEHADEALSTAFAELSTEPASRLYRSSQVSLHENYEQQFDSTASENIRFARTSDASIHALELALEELV